MEAELRREQALATLPVDPGFNAKLSQGLIELEGAVDDANRHSSFIRQELQRPGGVNSKTLQDLLVDGQAHAEFLERQVQNFRGILEGNLKAEVIPPAGSMAGPSSTTSGGGKLS